MTPTTADWRDYIVSGYGFFRAQIPAHALAPDLLTVVGDATVEVTAEAGVDDQGVTVALRLPGDYTDVWFEVGPARGEVDTAGGYAAAITAAAQASGDEQACSVQLHGWSTYSLPDLVPVPVEVTTDPDQFDGVYLDITDEYRECRAVLLDHQAAADTAAAIDAAVDYLTQVTEDPDTRVEGGVDLHGNPVCLDVVVALRREPQITLFHRPTQGHTRMAVLTVEQCRDLRDALDNATTTTVYVRTVLAAADEDGDPLQLEFETGPQDDDVITFDGAADQHSALVWLAPDATAELCHAVHGALAAAEGIDEL